MNKVVLIFSVFLMSSFFSHSQEKEGIFNKLKKKNVKQSDSTKVRLGADKAVQFDRLSAGLGLGLDYGGLGTNTLFYVNKNIAPFVGLGYDLVDLGWTFGIKYRFFSKKRPWDFHPYLVAMYGVNSIIVVENASDLDRSYTGTTVGMGFETSWKEGRLGYWSFGLLFPIESEDSQRYADKLEALYGIQKEDPRLPVEIRITVGYHFVLSRMK